MEVGKLTHSHSQPGGMDRTPPGTPKKGGKMLAVRVQMLDDTITMFQVQAKALGKVLFDQVCNQLHLLESDYFGLEYQEVGGTKYWLDLEKPLSRQIGLSLVDTLVRFCVKFYTPDPSQLEEEFTRYLFCLQIKRDLSQGLLQCNTNTAALLASYIVQAECGDYVIEDYPDHRYLSSYKFVPNQDQDLERRIMENHKKHAGQSPAEADLNLLETARRCELYGIKMHPAKDHEGAPLNLAVAHMGIVVFQNFTKINTFSWGKIRKISFKRKRFLVKLHPEGYGHYKDTVEFFFEGRNECKNFWKKCVENHGFFRCTMVKRVPRQKTRVLSRGSSFRYSGRTQKQIVDFVRENYVKRQTFQRSQSFRHSSSAHSSVANVGTSISAHPLLPLGDNAVAGTPASLSCGSMTLTSSPLHTADIHAGGSPSPPLTTSVSPGTSVTSSPQHFYPQETPYRRAGHQPTKTKHPHMRSHHAISPLQSPTDAATAANNRSASLSNNNVTINGSDIKSSRISLKSPDYSNINDVYSTCYSSLRGSQNNVDGKINDHMKSDIFNLGGDFVNSTSKSSESIRSSSKKSKPVVCKNSQDIDRYTWHRSASCKDLYHEENVVTESSNEKNLKKKLDPTYEVGFDFPVTRYDNSKRKCYSAVTSKNPSIDRTNDVMTDMKIYSSSYPGTTSSLSTESAEGEPDDRIIEMIDVKYDSQEEIALSHDDVSHDSYELLERQLDDYSDGLSRIKSKKSVSESERARSFSWESDRGMSPLDSRSTENVVSSQYERTLDKAFWTFEKERSPKHKSEIDFRSLNYKTTRNYECGMEDKTEKRGVNTEFLDYHDRFSKRVKESKDKGFSMSNRGNRSDSRICSSMNFGENELYRNFEQELRLQNVGNEKNFDGSDRKKCANRRNSFEELWIFPGDIEEGMFQDKQILIEERRRIDRKRDRRDSDERFHEGLKEKEQKDWEKERRQMDRRKNTDEINRKPSQFKANDYANFQEIHFKKFDRVISNQFGKYPEFLPQENTYDFLAQERKVIENYEKVCQVGRLAKELKENEKGSSISKEYRKVLTEIPQENVKEISKQSPDIGLFQEHHETLKTGFDVGLTSPKANMKLGKALVERTKSDPYNSNKNLRRNILMHQKSIDLTPQQSEETASDYDNEEYFKKTSRSEHDIPYILHKRHCMNGTAKNSDIKFTKTDFKAAVCEKKEVKSIPKPMTENKKPAVEDISRKSIIEGSKYSKQKSPASKIAEGKKSGVQIINLDIKNEVNIVEPKKVTKMVKTTAKKNENKISSPKNVIKKEARKIDYPKSGTVIDKVKKNVQEIQKTPKLTESSKKEDKSPEPIYAEVCKEKIIDDRELPSPPQIIPPQPPKRTTSICQKESLKDRLGENEKKELSIHPNFSETGGKELVKPSKKSASVQKAVIKSVVDVENKTKPFVFDGTKVVELKKEPDLKEEIQKTQPSTARGKSDLTFSSSVLKRREESLILFARTRLGLSEGSAFTPIVRQGRVSSPASQRRAKSLDAPYVSVHSLPPVDAFSSKDDTVDGNDNDVVESAVARAKELFKSDLKKPSPDANLKTQSLLDPTLSTESEVDSVFLDNLESDGNFKKAIESQSKVEISYLEEKVLDSVRSKRLLSKIESVDVVDSEGDLDSSKLADPPPIPTDRLVNLPESIRFPSVRQISGQTSEESADGWDHREVKVKRRTPRRSVGREEQSNDIKESVVWDSKDDEPPDDDVWDDNLVFTGKYEGSAVTDSIVPVEYLKRGSCGQSIDDDNLSTPMKESSPEHWVSVDDLPEALEREEKLLRQQEKILREKILNEKLKRELNLDTIDLDERYYEYRLGYKQRHDEDGLKDKFKGHSLDTYELNEKRLRERGAVKNSSLDEHLLGDKPIKKYNISSSFDDDKSSYENVMKASKYPGSIDYIQCKVVKDVTEIDQFGDNDEELEEFFVVLDENLGNNRNEGDMIWDEDETFRRTVSNEESLISVPEEFKDVEKEAEEVPEQKLDDSFSKERVEIRLSEVEERGGRLTGEEHIRACQLLQEKLHLVAASESEEISKEETCKTTSSDGRSLDDAKVGSQGDIGRLSPYSGSRRGSEEQRKLSTSDDTGRLSPYSSRRSSDDPRRLSASDDAGRLSPFNDSRRGSEDPRRLSTSEDSRKYSMSESISEETRRRLSSTEETRRKRASLTKQCSVGADSLSDEIISGIQECSSSFENDEKDVFEAEPTTKSLVPENIEDSSDPDEPKEKLPQTPETPQLKQLEIQVSEDTSACKEVETDQYNVGEIMEVSGTNHLAPPSSERELSRETEDSVDYCEEDFKDIREAVKEKEISEGLICDNESVKLEQQSKPPSSFEKSESSEGDELRYIDDKRGSTPEIIVGKSKEAVAMSIVVVNEGISVLNRISESGRWLNEAAKAHSLPRELDVSTVACPDDKRHTLPKKLSKPKPIGPKPKLVDYVHGKIATAVPSVKGDSEAREKGMKESISSFKSSLDSSQESDIDKLGDYSLISLVQSQIARRNLSDAGKRLKRNDFDMLERENISVENEKKTFSEDDLAVLRTSSEEREKTESSSFELKSSADELAGKEDTKWKGVAVEKRFGMKSSFETSKTKKESGFIMGRDKRSPEQEKRDSGEDGSSSSSAPLYPKRELSSTWKPFLLESSGSSSLEEGWLPPDDNAHLADEEETSSTSNNQQDDSYHDDMDYPTGIGYPVMNMSGSDMVVAGYGSVYALSRTLSRISERSTSEQERSDIEDDITKPSSHSVSVEEESIMSSDHQPSLSSDPPSPREIASGIPDLPDDRPTVENEDKKPVCEPFGDVIPPPIPDDDWPSPPSSSSVVDTPVVSHIETFYIEIHPEEACKVVVAEPHNEEIPNNVSETSDVIKNNAVLSSTPLQNGKPNGEISQNDEVDLSKSSSLSSLKPHSNAFSNQSTILSDLTGKDQNSNESPTKGVDSFIGQNTLDSKVAINNNRNTLEGTLGETEIKKKRYNTDKGYFIIKELLSTERTYKKDLDVINIWFHEEVSKSEEEMPDDVLNGLFNLFDPLSAAHSQFLRDLEQRLATWEGKGSILPKRDPQKIGDVILNHFNVLPLYVKYLDKHLLILERLDAAFRKNKKFEQVYRDFELQRVCYLPLSSFVMKPLQRLLHYNNLLKRLIKHYGPDHVDYKDFSLAQNKLEPIIENVPSTLKTSENFIQLSELQRDMPSFEGLLQGGREFIRQGCLLKHSKKGFQQRMFFLFSDILVYTNRTTTPSLQFKVNGQMPLRGVMVEESEDRIGTNFSFTIYGGNRTLTVAASSQEEKDKWLEDLFEAVQNARERNDGKMLQYLSLKSCSSSDEIMDNLGDDANANRNKNSQQRSNTTVHVCWHRNTSTSLQDHLRAFENELSGFLLRKFKNSNGWQKLWVVFTNFCLFFYKAYLDESPLASLPLLGYTVTVPTDDDDIRKDYVFKLQFKNHVYFFRAESDYTFSRWMEVIGSATKYSSRTKSLTKKDSLQNQ